MGWQQELANSQAWQEGVHRLDAAIEAGESLAFEATLGGDAIPARIAAAAATHDLHIWFCGLESVSLHIARVRARVEAGGHGIPEPKIRERYTSSIRNLIGSLPSIQHLQVYDNSTHVPINAPVPDPVLVAEWQDGRLVHPSNDPAQLALVPDWAKPIIEAALSLE